MQKKLYFILFITLILNACNNELPPAVNNTKTTETSYLGSETKTEITIVASITKENYRKELQNLNLSDNQVVFSPFTLKGTAPGNWFFEGTFPIKVLNSKKEVMTQNQSNATDNWQQEGPVNFESQVIFDLKCEKEGFILLENDNPSGLEEYHKEALIPVKFTSSYKEDIEAYIRQNISKISPKETVLGGSWYLTKIEFDDNDLQNRTVSISYEDGHIEEKLTLKYGLLKNGGITLTLGTKTFQFGTITECY